jgi:hypothetical protein
MVVCQFIGDPAYTFFKDFASPMAASLGAIAAVSVTIYFSIRQTKIASDQAKSAREKIRYDLFDRRFKIFENVFDFYYAMIAWNDTPEQNAVKDRYFKGYQASAFLFSKESGVEKTLEDFLDDANKVIYFRKNGDDSKEDHELYMRLFKESTRIQTFGAEEHLAKIKSAMSEYLNFENYKR